ncbi:MAG: hypothetical protein GF317_04075 [Candidatus Lokiarchaeota archaeon]|nr:hypothetical protein [Candidatus Lokiarchaeota archaeon]MBD3199064.1 hypothetical protein [Candidatus Lokiarchaeota archaeon]
MEKHSRSNLPDQKRLNELMKEIKTKANLLGVLLSYKDGRLLAKAIAEELNLKEFVPMIASVLKSAEGLGESIGEKEVKKIITHLKNCTIIISQFRQKSLFLTFLLDHDSLIEPILKEIDNYLRKIKKIV